MRSTNNRAPHPLLEDDDDDEGPGMLFSPAFWIGGAISVLIWLAVFL